MTNDISIYLASGCGRCDLFDTPQCKTVTWSAEIRALRQIMLSTELTEEMKWGSPVYTLNGKNVIMLAAFKPYVCLSFFKGALLEDPYNLLHAPGKNSQVWHLLRFTSVDEIPDSESMIREYIAHAIAIERAGKTVDLPARHDLEFPPELESVFENDPAFKAAFEALTPGRQRGYNLHFTGAKQSKTRYARIEKCMPAIMEGKGLHDR